MHDGRGSLARNVINELAGHTYGSIGSQILTVQRTGSTIIMQRQGGAIAVPIRIGVVRSKWRELQTADYHGPRSGIHGIY